MSVDNVIAIAGAAKGELGLVIFGLVVSVPIIVWGSTMVMSLMDRFPIVIVLGAALLGWIAGGMLVSDASVVSWVAANAAALEYVAPVLGAAIVVITGKLLAGRAPAAPHPVDLASPDQKSE
jgi:predicted tellurium resistance membrane protein TerC